MGIWKIESLQENDVDTLNSIKPDTWTSIAEIHQHYLATVNCHSIKVIINNQIVGIGTGIVFDKTGWLAHIIVSPQYQNRGIGSAIVHNRIEDLRNNHGCEVISLTATDQGYPVYKKIGFVEESLYSIMERHDIPVSSKTHSANIKKADPQHYSSIYELDRKASGENRKELLRRIIGQCIVHEENNRLTGFYLPGFGDGGVIAETEQAGISLLSERIQEESRIFVPEENKAAYRFLFKNGYKEVKKIHRMILGEKFPLNPQLCYARIGGFAG
jgi:Acetyltransferase (GNAT) family.